MRINKKAAAVAVAAVTLAGSGVAYAYWTSTGTGSGSAAVGTAANNLVVTGSSATTLTPNGPTSVVSFTAANASNFNQRISNIRLASVEAYPTAGDRTAGTNLITGCGSINNGAVANAGTNDFYMADVPVTAADGDIVKNATAQALAATGTLLMNDTTSDQGSCKTAVLKLVFTTT